MSNYLLTNDPAQIGALSMMRVLVASAMVFAVTIHYFFMGVTYFMKTDVKVQRMYDHGRRLVFYGLAGLLSMNFLIYGQYHAILAWVTLLCVFTMHCMAMLPQIKQDYQNGVIAFYYTLIAIWFIGILFFFIFNATTN